MSKKNKKVGLNVSRRILSDGTIKEYYYERNTRTFLGNDKETALRAGALKFNMEPPRKKINNFDVPGTILDIGDAGELFAMAELRAIGCDVLLAPSHSAYDFMVCKGNSSWRVQVKTRTGQAYAGNKIFYTLVRPGSIRSYHSRGVHIIAFVYWPARSIVFRTAKEVGSHVSIGLNEFTSNVRDVEQLWGEVTRAVVAGTTEKTVGSEDIEIIDDETQTFAQTVSDKVLAG